MFKGAQGVRLTTRNFILWLLLAYQAGALNAGGFLACGRFVSHVTGFATYLGFELAHKAWFAALGMLTVPIFFLLGAFVCALLVDRRIHAGKRPLDWLVMILILGCLVFVVLAGQANFFGPFGEPLALQHDYALLAALCAACGLQNALVTTASGAVVRTTHLTGITTDLGIGLAKLLFLPADRRERAANIMRIAIIVTFSLGSWLAVLLHIAYAYKAFLLPVFISSILFLITARDAWLHRKAMQPPLPITTP